MEPNLNRPARAGDRVYLIVSALLLLLAVSVAAWGFGSSYHKASERFVNPSAGCACIHDTGQDDRS